MHSLASGDNMSNSGLSAFAATLFVLPVLYVVALQLALPHGWRPLGQPHALGGHWFGAFLLVIRPLSFLWAILATAICVILDRGG